MLCLIPVLFIKLLKTLSSHRILRQKTEKQQTHHKKPIFNKTVFQIFQLFIILKAVFILLMPEIKSL